MITLADWRCSAKERKYVNEVLDSGWLTYGPFCKRLEAMWSKYHGCKYGVINNSGTSALQLAFRALKELHNWPEDSEILVPAVTFPATINMVIESGLTPILVDVEYDGGYRISDIKKKITSKTVGACIVHLWGNPHARKKELLKACEGLAIIEDSCETIDKSVGHWGDISCFSMYFNHIISAGVGGMACTNDPDLEYLMRSLANHGMIDVHATPKYKRFEFSRIGYSMRVTEMEAALGCAQFERVDSILAKRAMLRDCLTHELQSLGIHKHAQLIGGTMMYPIIFKTRRNTEVMDALNVKGIETRTMLPITNQSAFIPYLKGPYPVAEKIDYSGMFLPIHPMMTKGHCKIIAKALSEVLS